MKKICWLISILFAFNAMGQENDFTSSDENLGEAQAIQKPSCNTPLFKAKALETIKSYLKEKPAHTSINKRKTALKLKNLTGFENEDVSHFSFETDYLTANALLELKINQHIDEKDILLCRAKGDAKRPIYILSYPYMDNFKAYIIGLDEESGRYDQLSFIYP